jgi:hypothetical protein
MLLCDHICIKDTLGTDKTPDLDGPRWREWFKIEGSGRNLFYVPLGTPEESRIDESSVLNTVVKMNRNYNLGLKCADCLKESVLQAEVSAISLCLGS